MTEKAQNMNTPFSRNVPKNTDANHDASSRCGTFTMRFIILIQNIVLLNSSLQLKYNCDIN